MIAVFPTGQLQVHPRTPQALTRPSREGEPCPSQDMGWSFIMETTEELKIPDLSVSSCGGALCPTSKSDPRPHR